MNTKLYEKIKNYIKKRYKFIISVVILMIFMLFPLPYYIYTPGKLININKKYEIEGVNNTSSGSFNMVYVNEIKATPPTYLASFLFKTWTLEKKEDVLGDSSSKEDEIRNDIYLSNSFSNAVLNAYQLLNKKIDISNIKNLVIYIDKDANTDLKLNDNITHVNGNKIDNINDYMNIISTLKKGDMLELTIKNKEKEVNKYIELKEIDGKMLTGISFVTNYDYNIEPEIKFKFNFLESGPSAGLMLALSIYDTLGGYNLTDGKKIAGTGTIEMDGTIGAIGGIEEKVISAVNGKVDLFIVPEENYKDAIKKLDELDSNIKIIEVKTFVEAVNYLKNN